MIVADTSLILALLRARDQHHAAARAFIEGVRDELITSPLAVAEVDYMASRFASAEAREALWRDFERGAYAVRWWSESMAETVAIARRDPDLGLTDASLVALAGRAGTDRIASFDQRLRRMTTLDGKPLRILPADGAS